MKIRRILIIVLLTVILSIQGISIPKDESFDQRVKSIAGILGKMKQKVFHINDYQMPEDIKSLITDLKFQLRMLVYLTLNNRHGTNENVEAYRKFIIEKLDNQNISVVYPKVSNKESKGEEEPFEYGHIYNISIDKIDTHKDLIVATTTIGILCGEDTSLYLFKRYKGNWYLIFEESITNYDTIDEAYGWFNYGISPSDGKKNFILITANINPWCTSFWQQLRYQVYWFEGKIFYSDEQIELYGDENQFARSFSNPEVETIFKGNDNIYIGVDPPPYSIKGKSKEFLLKYRGGCNLHGFFSAPDKIIRFKVKNKNDLIVEYKTKPHK